jgi:hypothetical protein
VYVNTNYIYYITTYFETKKIDYEGIKCTSILILNKICINYIYYIIKTLKKKYDYEGIQCRSISILNKICIIVLRGPFLYCNRRNV